MRFFSISSDKLAISFSMICVVHCLAFPLLVALLPSIAILPFEPEAFHFWMVMVVIPTSMYALTLGCKKHKHFSLLAYGAVGLASLTVAVLFGESHLGEFGEKLLTVIGAVLIAFTHLKNFKLCQSEDNCPCPEK